MLAQCSAWWVHWPIQVIVLLLWNLPFHGLTSGRILPDVHWNTSNSMFQGSNNEQIIINVDIGDTLKIVCPFYGNTSVQSHQWEYYLIELVEDRKAYDMCIVNEPRNNPPILNCSTPLSEKWFTVLIWDVQPVYGVPDFTRGRDFYLLSTSGGRPFNLNNQVEGACKEHNMRIILRVRNSTASGGGGGGGSSGGGGGNTNTPVVSTTQRPTTRSSTKTTTSTTTSTTSTTTSTTQRTTTKKPRPGTGGTGSIDPDGFPDDKFIHAGDGDNVNSGIIEDNGTSNFGLSLHSRHRHSRSTVLISGILCALLSRLILLC